MESPEERLARLEDLCEFLLASTVQLARLGKENNDTLYDKMFKEASEKRGQGSQLSTMMNRPDGRHRGFIDKLLLVSAGAIPFDLNEEVREK